MHKPLLLLWVVLSFSNILQAQLQSPDEFLPHQLGENFTPHYMLVDYVEHVAANSPIVQLQRYGSTYEDRPLMVAYISTEENLSKLEDIRKNNLRRAGLLEGETQADLDRAIVWMSFGVHGNEAGGSESSMAALYELARADNAETKEWLKNTIVILDPSLNPDGYSRYTHWYRSKANKVPNPNRSTWEHDEPWPGGRVNHYLFDLNRDWAWQTQKETRERMVLYHQWMPHVHPDFHEQYPNSPYYFAPAARPYHKYITDWQADFQVEIGKNHADHFDKNGWLYFTGEFFDLFYPSYGDTYPIFNGAIGMTYEQAGHGISGLAILMENGDTLTLQDRIDHHRTTAMSTVEYSSKNAARLLENFSNYFINTEKNPPGKYKTFVIKGDNPARKIKALCTLLDRNKIEYGKISRSTSLSAYDYQNGKEDNVEVTSDDLVISAYQPKGVLTQVLLEPQPYLEDSVTYDITSWALPYAYGLEAYASEEKVSVNGVFELEESNNNKGSKEKAYAYLASWKSVGDVAFLSALLKNGIKVRFATSNFQLEGRSYDKGTIIATQADNRKQKNFEVLIQKIAEQKGQSLVAAMTGFTDRGQDLGSSSMFYLKAPQVAVLAGDKVSANSLGQIWHYFEQEIHYPISVFNDGGISGFDLKEYDLLILPEGWHQFSDDDIEELGNWVSEGGRLIAIGSAINSLKDKKGFAITQYASSEDEQKAKIEIDKEALQNRLDEYDDQDRKQISRSIPGAIVKLKMDNSHPLGYGFPDYYFSLKTSSRFFQIQQDAWNVGTIGEDLMVSGFAGAIAKDNMKNTVVFAVQDKGRGSVTYMIDNPLYRSFWENGKFLFSNAVFFVGQ